MELTPGSLDTSWLGFKKRSLSKEESVRPLFGLEAGEKEEFLFFLAGLAFLFCTSFLQGMLFLESGLFADFVFLVFVDWFGGEALRLVWLVGC